MIDIFHSRTTIIIVSIIWGIGLTLLFKKTCLDNKCSITQVPQELIRNKNIINSGDKCYQLIPYPSECLY